MMKKPNSELDLEDEVFERILRCRPFTMTSVARMSAMVDSTRYISRRGLQGSIVECGVWKGGSVMVSMLTILEEGLPLRDYHLFDTFEGMTSPEGIDVDFAGVEAAKRLADDDEETGQVWAKAGIDEVRANIEAIGYPMEHVHFVQGRVEDTVQPDSVGCIALLRLDTDWYASTKHELVNLYPNLVVDGVLIIDDYGYWRGSRAAVDEYLEEKGIGSFLFRIDNTGRMLIKR
jgi:O-methyltransferase